MSEEQEAPKKITLTVPSLFIRSSGSSSQANSKQSENGGDGQPSSSRVRPMPASARKKLEEEAKKKENESFNNDDSPHSVIDSTPSSQDQDRKPSRPMPASARRKLESAASTKVMEEEHEDKLSDTTSVSGSSAGTKPMPASAKRRLENTDVTEENKTDDVSKKEIPKDQTANKNKRPMPASAKRKLEAGVSEKTSNRDEGSEKPEGIRNRPMPSSVRKTLELSMTDNKKDDDQVPEISNKDSSKETDAAKAESRRPMPASARLKRENNLDSLVSNAEKKPTIDSDNQESDMCNQTVIIESSADTNRESCEPESDFQVSKEVKKISLGGIKFPTFTTSAKPKMETKNTDSDTRDSSDSHLAEEKRDESVHHHPSRSSRRGRSSTQELLALEDQTYTCEICGYESYSLSTKVAHEKKHFEDKVNKNASKKEASTKKKAKPVSKYRGLKTCPHCNQTTVGWKFKKISLHVRKCKKLLSSNEPSKSQHKKESKRSKIVEESISKDQEAGPVPIPMSNLDLSDEPVPSPLSDGSRSSKASAVEKPKPMPKSVKLKLQKEDERQETTSSSSSNSRRISGITQGVQVQSFKRKIADVLSTLGNRKFNSVPQTAKSKEETNEESNDDDGPPRKKTILSSSSSSRSESIRGHPMPASVKSKLQNRQSQDTPVAKPSSAGLRDDECEVCHKILSLPSNRVRHERTVHNIQNPRGVGGSPAVASSSNAETSPVVSPAVKEKTLETKEQVKLDLKSIPKKGGQCPICSKYISSRVYRHIQNVHKISLPPTSGDNSRHKISYKIYKSNANKVKSKLAASSLNKKPSVNIENVGKQGESENEVNKTDRKLIGTTASSELRCACCDKIFEVKCDFYEHMTMQHHSAKRLVTCKICDHKFSHEEDFLLHIQFKHQTLVAGMMPKKLDNKSSKKNEVTVPKGTSTSSVPPSSSRRSLRKFGSEDASESSIQPKRDADMVMVVPVSVSISVDDRKRAENSLVKVDHNEETLERDRYNGSSRRSTRKNSTGKLRTPEPEEGGSFDDNNDSDNYFDDSQPMEVEESEIAITSTFSQKVASPNKSSSNMNTNELDPMHCSSCSEVFYSYEALRKHELYFHNVKTTKMCPICGVYPTRLSRHLLAHENKTVRCTCVPCKLAFSEFSQLLKHNLEKHPAADGGTLSPTSGEQQEAGSKKTDQATNGTELYRCLLCKKEFSGGSNARRHIRRNHPEQDANPDSLVEKIEPVSEEIDDRGFEDILEDTSKKLLDSDWEDDVIEIPKNPPSSVSSDKKKPINKPMPASVRAKLQKQEEESKSSQVSSKEESQNSDPPRKSSRAMPASVRARLEAEKNEQTASTTEATSSNTEKPKPVRAMPASVRAKLMSAKDSVSVLSKVSSTSSGSNTPKGRAMPASAKVKLGMANATDVVMKANFHKVHEDEVQEMDSEPHVIELDDDPMDDSLPEPEPLPPSAPTFSISDEIAEHNNAVDIVMGGNKRSDVQSSFDFKHMFQCKMCNKKFETAEGTRRHIRCAHSEYGPDLAENLIGQLFEDYAHTPRRRRNNVRYTEDDDEDDEEEVIITRGTTRRPKQNAREDDDWNSGGPPDTSSQRETTTIQIPNQTNGTEMYACKWCGQTKDSVANIKRHISKAHPHLANKREEGVILVEQETKAPAAAPLAPAPRPQLQSTPKAGNPIYVCKICSKCMTVRSSLYVHIIRYHPEVEKGTAPQYIQELNGNKDPQPFADSFVPPSTSSSDNSFYCSICSYQTLDERDYVRHYKGHTGVSPYQCQYCAGTFNRQQELNAHVTREHTGAEFLTHDESEISMEEMVASNEISVAVTSKIQIETPVAIGKHSSEVKPKKYTPGPASRKAAAARKSAPSPVTVPSDEEAMETENSPAPSPVVSDVQCIDNEAEKEFPNEPASNTSMSYQGDLSSLFPTLGGGAAPGGIDALDDIDGGMSLD